MSPRALLLLVALQSMPAPARAGVEEDTAALKARGIAADGPALLALFKKRTPPPDVQKKIGRLIESLDADDFETREKAMLGLVEIGSPARGRLAEAARSGDAEVRRRATWILGKIGPAADDGPLLAAAARVLVARWPAGTLEALLAFLPHIDNADTADEIADALAPLAADKGKADPLAIKALSSPHPAVRSAAGKALAGTAATRDAVRTLLADPVKAVRRRVALALLRARDKEAVPTLVALTGAGDADALAAEDALTALAGDSAPAPPPDGPGSRDKTRTAWAAWWKDAGPTFDLARADLDAGGSRLSLLGVEDGRTGGVKLLVLGPRGEARHTVTHPVRLVHAGLAGPGRILACEVKGRVVELDLKGNLLWSMALDDVKSAQRLRDGRTFLASPEALVMLDPERRPAYRIRPDTGSAFCAHAFEDGTVSAILEGCRLVRYGKDGKEVGRVSFGIGRKRHPLPLNDGVHAHFGSDGGILLPVHAKSRVYSFDKDGALRWSAKVQKAWTAAAAPGGGWTVVSRYRDSVFEISPGGAVAKTTVCAAGTPLFLTRR